jgi:hypothetical protein
MPIHYKNCILESDAHQSPETMKWGATINISKQDEHGNLSSLPFILKMIFDTKKEADDNAYGIGKLIIDGEHPIHKLHF